MDTISVRTAFFRILSSAGLSGFSLEHLFFTGRYSKGSRKQPFKIQNLKLSHKVLVWFEFCKIFWEMTPGVKLLSFDVKTAT
jgi:hypothetical protein